MAEKLKEEAGRPVNREIRRLRIKQGGAQLQIDFVYVFDLSCLGWESIRIKQGNRIHSSNTREVGRGRETVALGRLGPNLQVFTAFTIDCCCSISTFFLFLTSSSGHLEQL